MSSALCPLSPTRPPKRPRWVWLTAITDTAPYSCCLGSFTRPQNACLRFLTAGPGCHFQCGTNLGFSITNKDRPAIGNRNLAFFVPAPILRAYLKNPTEIRSLRFGVPPLGGSGAVPPKGGTPNAIFRHALSKASYQPAGSADRRLHRIIASHPSSSSAAPPDSLTPRTKLAGSYRNSSVASP